jgi:hypothetical protein
MSKMKRTKSSSAGTARWDATLLAEPLVEDDWRLFLAFLIPDEPSQAEHIAALVESVGTKLRKRFVAVSREEIIQSIKDEGKGTATGAKKGGGKGTGGDKASSSLFPELCEKIRQALQSPDGITPDLDARLIKYYLLKKKREVIARKEAEKKAKEEAAAPKCGRDSTTKGTKTATGKGAKGSPKKGATEPKESDVPMPVKTESKMKKRGDEVDLFRSLDDEPEDGPDTYTILHGFSLSATFNQCAEIGVPINAIVRVSSLGISSSHSELDKQSGGENDDSVAMAKTLKTLWLELKSSVKLSPSGHALRDIAWLDLPSMAKEVPDEPEKKADYAESLYNQLAQSIYKLLEDYKQYQLYLQTLQVIDLSAKPSDTSATDGLDTSVFSDTDPAMVERETDTRLYKHLMDSLPSESVTIPLVMHCMLEQVVANVDDGGSDAVLRVSQDNSPLKSLLDSSVMKLALSTNEKKQLVSDKDQAYVTRKQKGPTILRHHDTSTLKTHFLDHVDDFDPACTESRMLQLLPYYQLRNFSLFGADLDKKYRASCSARRHELDRIMSAYGIEKPLLDRVMKQLVFESMPLKGTLSLPSPLFKTSNVHVLWDDPYPKNMIPISDMEELDSSHLESLQLRQLDDWCFYEHLEPSVMLQVLQEAHLKRLHVDKYYHNASNSLFLVMHNPWEKCENRFQWSNWIHSQVGFSNYLQHVSSVVGPTIDAAWTLAEAEAEQKTKAELERRMKEQAEADKRIKEEEKKEAEKENEKDKEKGGDSSSSSRCKSRSSKDARSASRSNASSRASTRKGKEKNKEKEKEKLSVPTKADPVTTEGSQTVTIPSVEPVKPEISKLYMAYAIGDRVLRVSGSASHLFPADGAIIAVKCESFTEGYTAQVVSVEKDDCLIMLHTRISEGNCTLEDATASGEQSVKDSQYSSDEMISHLEKELHQQQSQFLSFTVQYDDGLMASISKLSPEGCIPYVEPLSQLEAKSGTEISSKPSTPPQQARSPSVQKSGKKKDTAAEQALLEQQRLQEEADRQRQAEIERKKQERLDMLLRPKYQQLFVSSPDGLHLHYSIVHKGQLEELNEKSHLEGGFVVIRQSYPAKTRGLQPSEKVRQQPAMGETCRCITADGVVIKFLMDDSTIVLYPDGAVSASTASNTAALASVLHGSQPQETEEQGRVPSAVRRVKFHGSTDGLEEKLGIDRPRKDVWMSVSASGEQRLHTASENGQSIPQETILSYTATDPETKEVMFNRADAVCIIQRPDGSRVVNHADGTRITTFYEMEDGQSVISGATTGSTQTDFTQFVCVECPGFAAVTFNCQTQECHTCFGEGTKITSTNRGEYRMQRLDGSIVDITYDGEVCYIPKDAGNQVAGVDDVFLSGSYVFSPLTDEVLKTIDKDGSKFTVAKHGQTRVGVSKQESSQGEQMPRFFILHEDGSAIELLRKSDVADFLGASEEDPDAVVMREPVDGQPGATAITVLKPHAGTIGDKWLKRYNEDWIVPNGLRDRNFQNLSGRPEGHELKNINTTDLQPLKEKTASEIRPLAALEFRQLIEYQPLSAEERRTVMEGFCLFLRWREQQYLEAAALLLEDERSDTEKAAAVQLGKELLPRDRALVQDAMLHTAQDIYHGKSEEELAQQYGKVVNQCEEPVVEKPSSASGRKAAARLEEHQQELADLETRKTSLRERNVPNYFEMPDGLKFLEKALKEGPDMNSLASLLPENQIHPQRTVGVGGSQSEMELIAIQSSHSVASDSAIDPGLGALSHSPEKITPNQLIETPTFVPSSTSLPLLVEESTLTTNEVSPVRPTNPTPAHASGIIGTATFDGKGLATPRHADGTNRRDSSPTLLQSTVSERGKPSQPAVDPSSTHHQSTNTVIPINMTVKNKGVNLDVTGQLRKEKVKKPLSLLGSRPGATANEQFASIEDPVRRKVLTSSVAGSAAIGTGVSSLRGFELIPHEVNFGVLQEGYTYSYPVVIHNIGIDSCHFKLKQPPPSTGMKVLYKPGQVAAGMSTKLDVEIFAVAVGAVGSTGQGSVEHNLEITTETSIFHLPIKADILIMALFQRQTDTDRQTETQSVIDGIVLDCLYL